MRILRNYFERRRRAAAVAKQKVAHPFFHHANWLEAKLAFDREFRILMRTSYFYKT